jgi:hypothetical protein
LNRLFCFGLGYSARVLGRRLLARGWSVAGTCQREETLGALAAEGFGTHLFAPGRALDPAALDGTTHLLTSIPPDAEGDPVVAAHGSDFSRLPLVWVGYLSTTGVYGDTGGAPVDESAPLRPSGERGRRRVAAEGAWRSLRLPLHIFRLAGIYGPGRSALDTVREGKARRIDRPGHVFSRIHVEDIATVLEASIAHPNPGAAYNVCDDEPAAPAAVIEEACRLLGVEPPPLVAFADAVPGMSPMALSFWDDNRRVSNQRIKRELGVTLRYPTYREGLRALFDGGYDARDPLAT